MNKFGITENAYAKINLGLDIVGKRPDGYHLLRMVMQTLELHDTVTVRARDAEYGISTDTGSGLVKDDETNLAYRAASLIKEKCGIDKGMEIVIDKKIPVAAGLAGGSSDAAAVLRAADRLFSLDLGVEKLRELGLSLGADVPYCVEGGTMLCEGIGEVLTPIIPEFHGMGVLLIKPDKGVSTRDAYSDFDKKESPEHPDIPGLAAAVEKKDLKLLREKMGNVLEEAALSRVPEIGAVKDFLNQKGAAAVLMSGSGPTVFALDPDRGLLKEACDEGKQRFPDYDVILTETFCPERAGR